MRVLLLLVVFQLAACDVRTTKSPEDFPALHTVASVDSGIHAGGVSLVSFGGKNCGPCKKMRGILHELRKEKPELRIVVVYWEDAPEAFEHYRIGAIPAQIVFGSDGSEQHRHQGIWSKDDIHHAIASVR
jgi:thiol-disulfide isomerase/thioredoxin